MTPPDPQRRRLLQFSLAAGLHQLCPLSKCNANESIGPRAKSCILIYLDGGPSHIDTFDMKLQAPTDVRGPFQAISTSVPGISVCEHLPQVAQQMHRILQIRSVRHEETVHDPAVYQMLTGYKHISSAGGLEVEETDLPHMGSALAQADRTPAVMPKFIHTPDVMRMDQRILPGQNAGILPASYAPFEVTVTRDGEVVKPDFGKQAEELPVARQQRQALLAQLSGRSAKHLETLETERVKIFREQAAAISSSPAVLKAFEIESEPAAIRERYGSYQHGQSVLLARRLVETAEKEIWNGSTVIGPHRDDVAFTMAGRDLAAFALGYAVISPPRYGLHVAPRLPPWLAERGGDRARRIALLFHSTARAAKLWGEGEWIALAQALAAHDFSVVLAWGSAHERARAERIAGAAGALVTPSAPTLLDWAHLAAAASVAIGLDTGLTYLAAAVGTPVVAVYVDSAPVQAGVLADTPHVNLGDVGAPPPAAAVIEAALRIAR